MVRIFSSILRFTASLVVVAFTICVLTLVGFVAYKGTRPMQVSNAAGLTYWQFVGERVAVISELPPKCRQLHLAGYALTVPIYPTVYTLAGLFPDSFLARHTQPDPMIPSRVSWLEAPGTWWSLVEASSWEAWGTAHLPSVMPECNLPAPETAVNIRDK